QPTAAPGPARAAFAAAPEALMEDAAPPALPAPSGPPGGAYGTAGMPTRAFARPPAGPGARGGGPTSERRTREPVPTAFQRELADALDRLRQVPGTRDQRIH